MTPGEYVGRCREVGGQTQARSPFYVDYQYKWLPVNVLEFSEAKNKYYIFQRELNLHKHVD